MKLHTAEFKYTEGWKAKHDKQRKKAVVIAVAIPSHSYRKQQEEGTQETQEIAWPGKYIPSFVCNDASNDKIPASFTNITDIACTYMHKQTRITLKSDMNHEMIILKMYHPLTLLLTLCESYTSVNNVSLDMEFLW